MRAFRTALFGLVTIIAFSFSAFGQNFTLSPARSRTIDEQVYRKLKYLPNTDVFDHITWQVNGNTVVLTGKVYTLGTIRDAVTAVRSISGISEVVNNIQELPPSGFDDRIRRAAMAEFTSRGPAQYFGHPGPAVHVVVENGRITLEGYVARKSDSDLLNILANGIPGVFKVTNNLVIGERRF